MLKKMLVMCLFFGVFVLMTGCPNNQAPIAPTTTNTVDTVTPVVPPVTPPVVSTPPETPVITGGFSVKFDLSNDADPVAKSMDKATEEKGGGSIDECLEGLTYPQIMGMGNSMKDMASFVRFGMFDISSYENSYDFSFPIIDHVCDGQKTGLLPGIYDVNVGFYDNNGVQLFHGWKQVVIRGGETRKEDFTVELMFGYEFKYMVADLPGSYSTDEWGYGYAELVNKVGNGSMSVWYTHTGRGELLFKSSLPLNYLGGVLLITDDAGEEHQLDIPFVVSGLDWSVFNFSDVQVFPYVESDALGGIVPEIIFGWENQPIDAQGLRLPTIKITTPNGDDSTISIVVNDGDYTCDAGNWQPGLYEAGYGLFVIDYVIGGWHNLIYEINPGSSYNILKPDYVAWGWQYYDENGNWATKWFDNHKIVATHDGVSMKYQDYSWILHQATQPVAI